ncbi:aldehyde dehydrogenase family protein [Micromonospora sp. BRA006-A]|nr:aldehyde dehydrogenase family protein [Micromonospora sp. BRA006-A]
MLAGATDDLAVVTQEQFGPVLPVVPYTDLDDAVRAANAGPYGLGASVWSADPQRAWDAAARLDAGTVWVNSHAELAPDQPYGGLKCSGLGVEGGVGRLHGYTGAQVRHRPR